MRRKQHNFKVGDKIERDDGLTCTVERIGPVYNNIYGKNFSLPRYSSEITKPEIWKVVAPVSTAITTPSELAPSFEAFEVTILKLRNGTDNPLALAGFSSRFVRRETVDKPGEGLSYRNRVEAYLEEVAPDLSVPGEYIAVVIYGDGDTITRQFTVKPLPVKAPVEVTFA